MSQPGYAHFAIPLPLYRLFEYALDGRMPAQAGTRFRLPYASGVRIGVLINTGKKPQLEATRIKPALECLDQDPLLDAHILDLACWIADYYVQPLGEVVFQCLPGYLRGVRGYRPTLVECWQLSTTAAAKIEKLRVGSPRQYEICQALRQQPAGLSALQLKQINPNWRRAVKTLQAKELVRVCWRSNAAGPSVSPALPELNPAQDAALTAIEPRLDAFAVHLLDGITGSGKTEIYLRLIQLRLDAGWQVLYLVPEIGLTQQLLDRVRSRFGDCFVLSHSGLTDLQRFQAWDRFRRGEASIMLGTRSCIFSQCAYLGLIIVDEEHDSSYRQAEGSRYHARDVAIKRAQMLDIPILLGSATPSLESIRNCERDTYHRYFLDQRPTAYPPPTIELVDIGNSRLQFGCSRAAFSRIEHHLALDRQVLIYLNRRGFAPLVMCHDCGWQALCPHCDARLTLHHALQGLICHHCGFRQGLPEQCPDCNNPDIKHYGIGTEQLEQGLMQRFPATPILRIDRDVAGSREALKARLAQLQSGRSCILIGTQMIAKGHDYPAITLSVILDADQALFSASYRASERLLQTLFQVSGRAGRGDRRGEAIVQTRFVTHPLLQSLSRRTYREIADELLQERRDYGFPPFARVAIFRADALELEQALEKLEQIKALLAAAGGYQAVNCVGPMPALMSRRIGRYRAQLSLIAPDYRGLRVLLQEAMPSIANIPSDARVGWVIDIDADDL